MTFNSDNYNYIRILCFANFLLSIILIALVSLENRCYALITSPNAPINLHIMIIKKC